MPAPSDKQLMRLSGWPAGIDNRDPEQALTRDDNGAVVALRDAENVDLDRQGKVARRSGYTRIVSAASAHSLWGDPRFPFGLYVDNGSLMALREDGSSFVLFGGMGTQPVSYAVAAGAVYWSSTEQHGRLNADGVAFPWGVPGPGGPPALTANPTVGGLHAGRYQVTVTYLSPSGEESGASEAATVNVPEGGGIQLVAIPQPPDASYRVRVYASAANGDVLYMAKDLPAGITTMLLGVFRTGRPLETQFLEPMAPGHIVRWLNGRLYVAVGATLTYSEAMRYGLCHPVNNRIGFETRLAMVEPVASGDDAAGLYVASGGRVYWLPGTDPKAFALKVARPHGVVPGTSLTVPARVFGLEADAPVPYWLGSDGVACLGLPGGVVVPLRENQAMAPAADAGASLYRDTGSLRQVITTLTGAAERGVAIGDRLECEVYRHDP